MAQQPPPAAGGGGAAKTKQWNVKVTMGKPAAAAAAPARAAAAPAVVKAPAAARATDASAESTCSTRTEGDSRDTTSCSQSTEDSCSTEGGGATLSTEGDSTRTDAAGATRRDAPADSAAAPAKPLLPSTYDRAAEVGSGGRRLIVMRHGERIDRVFPNWLKLAFDKDTYKPYDLNMPLVLPKRAAPASSWRNDSALSEVGAISASMVGRALRVVHEGELVPAVIYVSPAYYCVQSAVQVAKAVHATDAVLRIEPGLFDWLQPYADEPLQWLKPADYAHIFTVPKIDVAYKPVVSAESLLQAGVAKRETAHVHYGRMCGVLKTLAARPVPGNGCALVVAHSSALDAGVRALLEPGKPLTNVSESDMSRLGLNYPYCCTVILCEPPVGSQQWRLLRHSIPAMTTCDFSTKVNHTFFNRPLNA